MIFSLQEYEARHEKCRALMKEAGIDVMMLSKGANIFYFSGYRTSLFSSHFRPFFVLIFQSGDPVLVVPNLEWYSAVKETWFEDVRFWGKGSKAGTPADSVHAILQEKGMAGCTIATELDLGQRLGDTYANYQVIRENLSGCRFVNATDITWKLRMVKSPRELAYMKEASRLTCCGFEALIKQVKAGMTEREMHRIVATEMMREGCEQEYFLLIGAGRERYNIMNPYPTDYAVQDGDLVEMDWGGVYNGYWSDLTRVFAVGSATDRQKELYHAANEIRKVAVEATRPGVPIGAVDEAATKRADELGVREYMLHRSGHTIGLEVHEIPSISASDRTVMEPGMCLTIEPALYDWPDVGSFRIEDLVAVTADGREVYSPSTTELIIVK